MNDSLPDSSPFSKIKSTFINHPAIFIPLIVFFGLIVRVLFIPNPGFEADISFWKSWGLAVYDHNVVWSIENTNNNYPTAFAYVLGAMAKVYSLFADPHNFHEFWSNTNLWFLTVSKLPSVLADFGIVALILYIGRIVGKKKTDIGFPPFPYYVYVLVAAAYILNPISIIDGAWWGQVDSLGVFIYLVALFLLLKRMPFWAGFIYMASMMTKLQNMIYGPVFFVLMWQLVGLPGLIKGIGGAMTAFVGLNFEFFLARKMNLVFESLTVNYDYFPFMSLNAYNLWWIVAKADGMHTLDKFTMWGLTNAKTMGLFLFSSSYLFAVMIILKDSLIKMFRNHARVELDTQTLLYRYFTALVIVAGAFFLFQTESHDRYAFPLVAYLPLWGLFYLHASLTNKDRLNILDTKNFKVFSIFYFLFSVIYFFNLHNAFIDNYPNNGIPVLVELNKALFTIPVSYLQLLLFGVFIYAALKHIPKIMITIPVLAFLVLMLFNNLPIILKKPILITKFFPIISQQNYLKRQTDMSVNSANGIKDWNPLSIQYAFYKHGIGTHSKSYHQYNIAGQFKRFTTDFGIDTEAGPNGSATFEIFGDDKPLFISEKIGRFDLPRHVEVDVTGVKMLGLVTNDAGDGINDDHTDWLNPILWP